MTNKVSCYLFYVIRIMLIGIDGNEANVDKQVGVSVYTLNLLSYFKKWSDRSTQFKIFLKTKPKDFMPPETDFFKYVIVKGNFLWSQLFLPLNLYLKNKVDVFFSPAHYAPRFCPYPQVVTIHDLAYLVYPNEFLKKDLYQLKNWTKYSINKAKIIIAVSKTTKKDLMKFYNIPEDKIKVVYNGFEKQSNNLKVENLKLIENFKLKIRNYILFVGTIQPRKNLLVLLKAFSKLVEAKPEFTLVITGKKGWLYEQTFQKVKDLKLEQKVVFTDHVSDYDLTILYKNAFCFVMPSLYEGFGIPLLEALANNCPVISSFASSLPEVGGETCLYFDPHNSDDLLDKINELIDNNQLRQELINKGKERIKLFSWKKSAVETLNILKNFSDD